MTASILERLKNESAPYHDRVEANPYASAIMSGTIDLHEYKQYLALFYGFIAPLERQAEASPGLESSGYDLSARRKTPMLEKDLMELGMSSQEIADIPLSEELPDVSTAEQLLGTFYVIEGSTMGGQFITRKLLGTLAITPDSGLSYFNAYGEHSRARWGEFRELLLAAGTNESQCDEITRSAIDTFRLLELWFNRNTSQA
ncbi:biliverdin-producing heme oxygenase [Saccharibacillus sp. JS10]|uniref:biliverdin-producing heme oxygenase n=1 Tax=Saccharibacillus sp. JS10 TaxID=2950552 RepID=UPI00210A0AB2|nr:biliverdin-producing heme oxygenase [Saccharibacillus sp. JS10]MCQ4085410.1 biliverdin-producing heme oxygenase [Saccharibacillus sp. JS10]